MSMVILMRILESAPSRYDWGIRLLTLGRLNEAYDRLASHIKRGQRVLDLGCGTGALTLRAAQRGAKVRGIDVNPQMLDIAQRKASEANLTGNIELCEMGVAELGNEASESYDVVMSGLCFSELTEDELTFALREIKRVLKPGGLLLVADEARPGNLPMRMLVWLFRFPLKIITYVFTQTTTRAVKSLPERVRESGLHLESVRRNRTGSFIEVISRKPRGRYG